MQSFTAVSSLLHTHTHFEFFVDSQESTEFDGKTVVLFNIQWKEPDKNVVASVLMCFWLQSVSNMTEISTSFENILWARHLWELLRVVGSICPDRSHKACVDDVCRDNNKGCHTVSVGNCLCSCRHRHWQFEVEQQSNWSECKANWASISLAANLLH